MSEAIRRRRGTTAQHAAFTGLLGEITVDTDKKTVVVHDGATAGGMPLAREGYERKRRDTIKTANYTVVAADASKWLTGNHATAITFALPAVAGADDEVYWFRNIGAGDMTLDPNSTEQIEGAATLSLATGAAAIVWPNEGKTAWRAVVFLSSVPSAARAALSVYSQAETLAAIELRSDTLTLASPNLNDRRDTGIYYANSPTNGPSGNGWVIHHDLSNDYAYQEFVGASGDRYYRNQIAGVWGSWTVEFTAATQAQQETGTSNAVAVTPGRQHYHPSAAKGWVSAGVTGNILASYNVSSVTDLATGAAGVNWNNDFSSNNYCPVVTVSATTGLFPNVTGVLAGSVQVDVWNLSGALADPAAYFCAAFGDH